MRKIISKIKLLTIFLATAAFLMSSGPYLAGQPPADVVAQFPEGEEQYVDLGTLEGVTLDGEFTIELWAKNDFLTNTPGSAHRQVIALGRGENAIRVAIQQPSYTDLIELVMRSDGQEFKKKTRSADELVTKIDFTNWYHLAVSVKAGEFVRFYANGRQVLSNEKAPKAFSFSGLSDCRIADSFPGRISNVRLWNRAMIGSEIFKRIDAEHTGDEDGLVGYWPLNEGKGKTAQDLAGNNDGLLRGEAKWFFERPFAKDLQQSVDVRDVDKLTIGPVKLRRETGEVTYQWYKDGKPIDGQTSKTLTVTGISPELAGSYYQVQVDDESVLTPVISSRMYLNTYDFLGRMQAYADLMVEKGRDHYGKKHTPLFADLLNRETHRHPQKSGHGCNPILHNSLYTLLYRLTEVTDDQQYAKAADRAIEWFFKNNRSPETNLLAWGQHLYWGLHKDKVQVRDGRWSSGHELDFPWFSHWDTVHRLAPKALAAYARGIWNHQIADHETGEHGRHARYRRHDPTLKGADNQDANQYIELWAQAYKQSQDPMMLKAIRVINARYEQVYRPSEGLGLITVNSNEGNRAATHSTYSAEMMSVVSLRDAAGIVDRYNGKKLADRLRWSARRNEEAWLQLPHDFRSSSPTRGFVSFIADDQRGLHVDELDHVRYCKQWEFISNARMANWLFKLSSRTNVGEHREAFQQMVLKAAGRYMSDKPNVDLDRDLPPGSEPSGRGAIVLTPEMLNHPIELMMNAHALTGEQKYLDRAKFFGRMAINLFFDQKSPLPKMSTHHDWYDASTGGPLLCRTLFELGLTLRNEN